MNIDEFKGVISGNPLLDPSRYSVKITGPKGLLSQDFSVLCNNVTLPGRGFSTVEKYNHGPVRKVPYAELYDDVTTTFMLTEDMALHEFFNEWQEFIAGDALYYVKFYSDFIGSVLIEVENKQDGVVATYELFEAWPSAISSIDLGAALTDIVPEFTVTWSYHHFERKPSGGAKFGRTAPVEDTGSAIASIGGR